MKLDHIMRAFGAMGARFKVAPGSHPNYAMDIRKDRQGEFFELRLSEQTETDLEVALLQVKPRDRHLLLLVKGPDKNRYLCGHDERSWFVAAVPGNASTVNSAKEALKPGEVLLRQTHENLSSQQRNRRKNRAFRRQGEWFFIPEPELVVDPRRILHNEPINRGRGKSHWLEQAFRNGGEKVYVHRLWPNGVSESDLKRLVEDDPKLRSQDWRVMVRNAAVYARGAIRHPDHKTIVLHGWHQVLMNTENRSRAMANLAFLD